ncbi:MAG TPA: hypothetical protein VFF64_16250 [Candidatus Eremiobacteraceae bacterium]|nr:hypothetical protein [Candidatus Eremiobacteraceae bacterium]
MNLRPANKGELRPRTAEPISAADRSNLGENAFLGAIWHEQKRAERCHKLLLLMLVEMDGYFPAERNGDALGKILSELTSATRETDITGWYEGESVVGVMFTEIRVKDGSSIIRTMTTRMSEALRSRMSSQQFNQISVSFYLLPRERNEHLTAIPGSHWHPDLATLEEALRPV